MKNRLDCIDLVHRIGSLNLKAKIELPQSRIVTITGRSGAGKTSFLRCLAGLETIKKSYINMSGITWQNDSMKMPVYKRSLGFVFQDARLLPHLSIQNHIEYIYQRAASTLPRETIERFISQWRLSHVLEKYPRFLSGGEKQRVALLCALIKKPQVLLLDEPFSAQDPEMKQDLIELLLAHYQQFPMSIFWVTHHEEDIQKYRHSMLVAEQGRIREHENLS